MEVRLVLLQRDYLLALRVEKGVGLLVLAVVDVLVLGGHHVAGRLRQGAGERRHLLLTHHDAPASVFAHHPLSHLVLFCARRIGDCEVDDQARRVALNLYGGE
jgi:hypothetical protein